MRMLELAADIELLVTPPQIEVVSQQATRKRACRDFQLFTFIVLS